MLLIKSYQKQFCMKSMTEIAWKGESNFEKSFVSTLKN